jgi:prevent-host-death family protein
MTTVSAREASRGFSTLLDHVEHDGEEYTIVRDGRAVARIVPAVTRTAADFLRLRAGRPMIDDDFARDATSADALLTTNDDLPWRD